MKVYMIQRKSDGFYSLGGARPAFHKNGRMWHKLAHVKLHLAHVYKKWIKRYVGCEIISFDLVPAERDAEIIDAMIAKAICTEL